jgi:hypothetical protein
LSMYELPQSNSQCTFALIPQQLDDSTFRELLMPLRSAVAARAGATCTDDAFTVVVRERDAEITRLKRRFVAAVCARLD